MAGSSAPRKLTRNGHDLGFVGEPERIDDRVLATFRQSDIIPVIAPIGVGAAGETYNINADTVAGAVAAAVKARRFLLADRCARACSMARSG